MVFVIYTPCSEEVHLSLLSSLPLSVSRGRCWQLCAQHGISFGYSLLSLCPGAIAVVRLLQKAESRENSQSEEFLLHAGPSSLVLLMPLSLVEQAKANCVGHSGGSDLIGLTSPTLSPRHPAGPCQLCWLTTGIIAIWWELLARDPQAGKTLRLMEGCLVTQLLAGALLHPSLL